MELNCYRVSLPLIVPFTTSFGTQKFRDALIFELNKDGTTAYSESVTEESPGYSYEDNVTAIHVIRDFLTESIKDLPEPKEFLERAGWIKGHNMAKGALEMLLWDFYSKEAGIPLYKYIGATKGNAEVGVSIGMDEIDLMMERAKDALKRGYKRIKVKIKKGMEEKIVSSVRSAIGEFPMSVDANTDYTLDDIDTIKSLDKYGLKYIEQPLSYDDLIDHSNLASKISTPICLDESITSFEKARKAISINACKVINIKPGRVAGFTESLNIAKYAHDHGIHVWIGGMLETGIGRAFNVSLASSSFVDYPGDTSPNDRYFKKDIVRNPFTMSDGVIKPNDAPGIGVEVDHRFLVSVTSERFKLL